ncbi:MAG: hypothetical protein Q8P82_01380 [bacterium]|nr:hypothetical protein [bacterium]
MDPLDSYLYSQGDGSDDMSGDADLILPQSRESDVAFGTPAEIALVQRFMNDVREKLDTIERIVAKNNSLNAEDVERLLLHSPKPRVAQGRIVEGVFDGEYMLGADGKQYTVPANYASKSKLVEGDILKLTITDDGTFVFKQIGPIPRERVIGTLAHDEVTSDYLVLSDSRKWNILLASVTYFRAEPGDQIVILVPKSAPSRWAAVENVIRKNGGVVESESESEA